MNERVIAHRTLMLSMANWKHDEIREHSARLIRGSLEQYLEDEGLQPLGNVIMLPPQFMRWVKEKHHAHGWQMTMQECSEEDAENVLLSIEVLCR